MSIHLMVCRKKCGVSFCLCVREIKEERDLVPIKLKGIFINVFI